MMKADPQPGPQLLSGYAALRSTDRSRNGRKSGQKVCVAAGCYKDVLVIRRQQG